VFFRGVTIAGALVIARAHRRAANHQSTSETKDWVVVLVSAQVEPLRLLDGARITRI